MKNKSVEIIDEDFTQTSTKKTTTYKKLSNEKSEDIVTSNFVPVETVEKNTTHKVTHKFK